MCPRVKRMTLERAVQLWELRVRSEITPLERNLLDQMLAASDGLPRKFCDEIETAAGEMLAFAAFFRTVELR